VRQKEKIGNLIFDVGSGASPKALLRVCAFLEINPKTEAKTDRGSHLLFSDKGLKDNLYAFLEEHHFEIEHKAFPKRPRDETDESEELIVLGLLQQSAQFDSRRGQSRSKTGALRLHIGFSKITLFPG